MSTALTGVTFAGHRVSPPSDGALFSSMLSDGIVDGFSLSPSGSTLHVGAGRIIACGRLACLPADEDLSVSGTSGYARVLLTLDMSKSADPATFAQAVLDVETAADLASFDDLDDDDVNNGGTNYQLILCVMALSAGGISSILWTCGNAHGRALGAEVTLAAANWSSKAQTVRVNGVHPDTIVLCTYAPDDKDAFLMADIDCTAQAEGSLTFSCQSTPEAAVKVNVLLL